jgi:hypothetical protein
MLDIQFDIGRELADVTVRAQVVGPRYVYWAHHREDRLDTQFPVTRLPAATAGHGVVVGVGRGKLEQFGQGRRTCTVHGRTHSHFDGFQIQAACFALAAENNPQKLVYFARDFLADRFRRFFSCSVGVSLSAGLKRQISAFVSTNSRLSC